MSILTKIFIVLVTILSVVLVALVVPFVMNTETYEQKWREQAALASLNEQYMQLREAAVAAKVQAANAENGALQGQINDLTAQVNTLSTELQSTEAALADARNKTADVQGQLARLSNALEQAAQVNATLQEEIKQRRDQTLALQQRNIQLNDKNQQLSTQLQNMTQQVRLFKEQIAELEDRNRELQNKIETGLAGGQAQPGEAGVEFVQGTPAQIPIQGRVTSVQPIGDETFVEINVGANDEVREGMEFMIHSGDQFLGNAVITKVDVNSSAGRVTLKTGDIAAGVEATSGT